MTKMVKITKFDAEGCLLIPPHVLQYVGKILLYFLALIGLSVCLFSNLFVALFNGFLPQLVGASCLQPCVGAMLLIFGFRVNMEEDAVWAEKTWYKDYKEAHCGIIPAWHRHRFFLAFALQSVLILVVDAIALFGVQEHVVSGLVLVGTFVACAFSAFVAILSVYWARRCCTVVEITKEEYDRMYQNTGGVW